MKCLSLSSRQSSREYRELSRDDFSTKMISSHSSCSDSLSKLETFIFIFIRDDFVNYIDKITAQAAVDISLDGSVLSLSEDSDEVVIIGETSAGFL